MARFARKTETIKTTNRAGGEAFKLSPKEKLVEITTTYFFNEPKFYGSVDNEMNTALNAVLDTDPEFVLKLANYLRNIEYKRTVPVYLLVKASLHPEAKKFIRQYATKIIRRADEIVEVMSCLETLIGYKNKAGQVTIRPIPNSIKKSLVDAFGRFDEYQLSKWG